jgi:hypothetical protein
LPDPIIRKVKDAVAEWATKSWPLSAHSEHDVVEGRPVRRLTEMTENGPEVVGIAHLLEPDRFRPVILQGERLSSDDPKRLREMFHLDVDEED